MSKYILELEGGLKCNASFHNGVLTLEDGKQIKLEEIKEEEKETYSEKMQDDLEPID